MIIILGMSVHCASLLQNSLEFTEKHSLVGEAMLPPIFGREGSCSHPPPPSYAYILYCKRGV